VLLDEVDNQDLGANSALRSVMNSGHRRGGKICRHLGGEDVTFDTYAPLALGVIGKLQLPLLHRSIVIDMQRSPHDLARFDENDANLMAEMRITSRLIARWARTTQINFNPDMPDQLRNRTTDNWRVLIGIADAISPQTGEAARRAAVTMSEAHQDEDFGVILIGDIISVFDTRGADKLPSTVIVMVMALHEFDHGFWAEWRGKRSNEQPRKLTQPQMAALLGDFRIKPRTIWPPNRTPRHKIDEGLL
jgi:Protein of unknown function (DUF3631)